MARTLFLARIKEAALLQSLRSGQYDNILRQHDLVDALNEEFGNRFRILRGVARTRGSGAGAARSSRSIS